MKIKFFDNEHGDLIIEQEKENAKELINALEKGKEINLMFMDHGHFKSVKGSYDHHTINTRDHIAENDVVCLYLNHVENIDEN
jgi:hypothetical protein